MRTALLILAGLIGVVLFALWIFGRGAFGHFDSDTLAPVRWRVPARAS
jgi:hypothetical protein